MPLNIDIGCREANKVENHWSMLINNSIKFVSKIDKSSIASKKLSANDLQISFPNNYLRKV